MGWVELIEYGVFEVHTICIIRVVAYTLVDSDQTESDRNFITSTRDTRTCESDCSIRVFAKPMLPSFTESVSRSGARLEDSDFSLTLLTRSTYRRHPNDGR